MATDLTSNQPVQPENEIDLIEVVKKLWTKRKFIIKPAFSPESELPSPDVPGKDRCLH